VSLTVLPGKGTKEVRLRSVETKVIPVVVGALGTVSTEKFEESESNSKHPTFHLFQ